MQFLYPYFLWALAALSVPIIIHLFNFRRTIKVYFSSLRFLRVLKEDNQSKLRLKHYLMLLFRLLFIACLVLAFSQPYEPSSIDLSANNKVSIYIDNSMSMSLPSAEGSDLFSEAVGSAQEIIRVHPAGTKFRIITNGLEPFSSRFISKDNALDLLTSLKLSAHARPIAQILERYAEDEVFYILSDFQKQEAFDSQIDSTQTVYLLPFGYTAKSNLHIDSVYLDRPFIGQGQKANVIVKLAGSNEAFEEVSLKLNVNQQQLGALAVNTTQSSTAEFVLEGNGKHQQGLVMMEEYPVAFDNEYYFALGDARKIKIAEIKEAEAVSPIERVFASEAFAFRSFKSSNIEYATLQESDFIVLNALTDIDNTLRDLLLRFSQNGGRILLIPHANTPLNTAKGILGESAAIAMNVDTTRNPLANVDFNNPFYQEVFEEKQNNLNMPFARSVLVWKASSTDLLQTRSAYPFLAEWAGKSNIFLMASPLQDAYTDFHLNALFVPIMQQLAFQSLRGAESGLLAFSLDQVNITVNLDSTFTEGLFKLKRGEEELIPTQQLSDNRLMLELPTENMSPGYYDLVHENSFQKTLAFNYPKSESKLEQWSGAELEKTFENKTSVKVFDFKSVENLKSEMNTLFIGQTYWKHFVVLALIFLLAEILVARFL